MQTIKNEHRQGRATGSSVAGEVDRDPGEQP